MKQPKRIKPHNFSKIEIDAFDLMRLGLTARGAAKKKGLSPDKFARLAKRTFPDRLELTRLEARKALVKLLADRRTGALKCPTVCYRCKGPKTTHGSLCSSCNGTASLREKWEAEHAFQT